MLTYSWGLPCRHRPSGRRGAWQWILGTCLCWPPCQTAHRLPPWNSKITPSAFLNVIFLVRNHKGTNVLLCQNCKLMGCHLHITQHTWRVPCWALSPSYLKYGPISWALSPSYLKYGPISWALSPAYLKYGPISLALSPAYLTYSPISLALSPTYHKYSPISLALSPTYHKYSQISLALSPAYHKYSSPISFQSDHHVTTIYCTDWENVWWSESGTSISNAR